MIWIMMIMMRFVMIVIMRFGMVMKENWSSFVVIMIMETVHWDHHICRWCRWRGRRYRRWSGGHYRGNVIVIIDVVHIVILIVTQHIAHFIHRNHLQG